MRSFPEWYKWHELPDDAKRRVIFLLEERSFLEPPKKFSTLRRAITQLKGGDRVLHDPWLWSVLVDIVRFSKTFHSDPEYLQLPALAALTELM